jgi:hypothetical protein
MDKRRDAEMKKVQMSFLEEKIEAAMGQGKGAAIEGGVDEIAEKRRAEMMKRNFHTGDLVSCCSVSSGMEVPCTVLCSMDQG